MSFILVRVKRVQIDIKEEQEDKIDDKLDEEEVVSVCVPFIVKNYLHSFLFEKCQVFAVLYNSCELDFVFHLDFVKADVIKLHFMLFLQVLTLWFLKQTFNRHSLPSFHQISLGLAPVVDVELLGELGVFILVEEHEGVLVLQIFKLVIVNTHRGLLHL